VYHLTRYKYWFFGISLAIILPGLLALIFWGLNLGIDYTGGTRIDLRFANNGVNITQVGQAFQAAPAHAQDVQVFSARDTTGPTVIPAAQYVYIQFSRAIGTSEQATVMSRLSDPKANLPAVTNDRNYYTYTTNSDGQPTALMVVHFDKAVQASAVQVALQKLPNTDLPPATNATPTPTAAATPSGTTTPASTATPTATATATATATPATGSTSTGPTFPVTVTSVLTGANAQTYQVNTQTPLDGPTLDATVFKLAHQFGPVYVQQKSEVGGSIANETTQKAIGAVALASLFILIYIAIAFRRVGDVWKAARFGASAIIALLHDAFVVLGLWAIFGHFFNYKVDTLFLTAVLTVIGFSVHDTIVVFDRIRENLARRTNETFEQVVDTSLIQTMSRSLNTSLTVLLTLSALTLFGGESIREFTLALLIGIASGTYSSIFNASMILTVWETGEYKDWLPRLRRLFGRGRTPGEVAASKRELAGTRA
jgi:preprotein translocase SecF subunit